MKQISLLRPKRIVFGEGCLSELEEDARVLGWKRIFLLTSSSGAAAARPLVSRMAERGTATELFHQPSGEPSIESFESARRAARSFKPDAVVGLGGGSVLDVAKLVAALCDSTADVRSAFGIELLGPRNITLVCLPTTSGSGSEVSPNAILLDPEEQLKKGVVSRHLVPDAAYVDPALTHTVPPGVTASTGLDALTHCIETYANRHSHPIVDLQVLEGIRLISAHLPRAVEEGRNGAARAAVALGSLYGGLALGPVNTAAVHALAYPLGSEFGIAHGLSNAVLLPHVLKFNLPAMPQRYAEIAAALGVKPGPDPLRTAEDGLARLESLCGECGVQCRICPLGVPEEAIPRLARAAMNVTRLLVNNPRELTLPDAEAIYRSAF